MPGMRERTAVSSVRSRWGRNCQTALVYLICTEIVVNGAPTGFPWATIRHPRWRIREDRRAEPSVCSGMALTIGHPRHAAARFVPDRIPATVLRMSDSVWRWTARDITPGWQSPVVMDGRICAGGWGYRITSGGRIESDKRCGHQNTWSRSRCSDRQCACGRRRTGPLPPVAAATTCSSARLRAPRRGPDGPASPHRPPGPRRGARPHN